MWMTRSTLRLASPERQLGTWRWRPFGPELRGSHSRGRRRSAVRSSLRWIGAQVTVEAGAVSISIPEDRIGVGDRYTYAPQLKRVRGSEVSIVRGACFVLCRPHPVSPPFLVRNLGSAATPLGRCCSKIRIDSHQADSHVAALVPCILLLLGREPCPTLPVRRTLSAQVHDCDGRVTLGDRWRALLKFCGGGILL